MKPKPVTERVPYRRGPLEEAALAQLGALRSPHVPALGSDNQWLRFAVRVLAELWRLAGKRPQALQVGRPGGRSDAWSVLAAPPPTALSSRLGEARLRAADVTQLEQLRREMGHSSRSGALRHALIACRELCSRVAAGDSVWIERAGELHRLPSLLELAADLEQSARGPRALIAEGAQHWSAEQRRSVLGDSAIESCRPQALFEKILTGRYDSACFEIDLPDDAARVRCVLRAGQAPSAELVPRLRQGRGKLVAVPNPDARAAALKAAAAEPAALKAAAARPAASQIGGGIRRPPGEWRARASSPNLGLAEELQFLSAARR